MSRNPTIRAPPPREQTLYLPSPSWNRWTETKGLRVLPNLDLTLKPKPLVRWHEMEWKEQYPHRHSESGLLMRPSPGNAGADDVICIIDAASTSPDMVQEEPGSPLTSTVWKMCFRVACVSSAGVLHCFASSARIFKRPLPCRTSCCSASVKEHFAWAWRNLYSQPEAAREKKTSVAVRD